MPVDLKELRRLHEAATAVNADAQDEMSYELAARNALPSLLDRLEAAEADRERLDWVLKHCWVLTLEPHSEAVTSREEIDGFRGHRRDAAREAAKG